MADKTNTRTHIFANTGALPWRYLNVHISAIPEVPLRLDFARMKDGNSPIFVGYIRKHDGEFVSMYGDDSGIAFQGNWKAFNVWLADELVNNVDRMRELIVKKTFLVRQDKEVKGGKTPTTRMTDSTYVHLVFGPMARKDLKVDTSNVIKNSKFYKVVELKGFDIVELNEKGYGLPQTYTHPDAAKIANWCEKGYAKKREEKAKIEAAQAEEAADDTVEANPL